MSSALGPLAVGWNPRDFPSLGKEVILFWVLFCITTGSPKLVVFAWEEPLQGSGPFRLHAWDPEESVLS